MIWFDQNKLEQRLLKGELSDHHAFIYLLAQLALICVLLQLPFEESSLWYVWLLISLVVTVAGVSWSFRINQKGGDRDYLRRFIALSFVAIMRCLLLVFFISILDPVYTWIKSSIDLWSFWAAFQEKLMNVLRGFILIFYFIYLIPSFKRLSAAEVNIGQSKRILQERQELKTN